MPITRCAPSLAIARVIREDNAVRRAPLASSPIRVRIGPHSGPVVGRRHRCAGPGELLRWSATRLNIAQRFEQLGKEFMTVLDQEEIVVLSSGEHAGRAGNHG